MAPLQAFVSKSTLFRCSIGGIVVTTITTVTRIYVRIKKQRRLHEDDFVLFTAVALYFALAILYIIDLPYLYRFLDYASGKAPFQPSLVETYDHMMRISFAVTALFWAVLWTVKLSLLLFFRRVLHAMPLEAVKKMWWFVLALTIVTFIGCLVSEFCSCNELKDFTTLGKCVTPQEQKYQIISLYYSFGADVLTELAIMAVPFGILINLRRSFRGKVGLTCLFCVGFIAIIVAMIRVFLIWAKTGSSTPSPAWLALWAIIEGAVAIIVGSIPAISQIFRDRRNFSNSSPSGNGFNEAERDGTDSRSRKQSIRLRPEGKGSITTHINSVRRGSISSEECLAPTQIGINIRREIILGEESIPESVELSQMY